jgi:hypothetical protein
MDMAEFILSKFTSSAGTVNVHGCTEYVYNRIAMQCHPSYKGEGPWFDWVSIHFEECTYDGITYQDNCQQQLSLQGIGNNSQAAQHVP